MAFIFGLHLDELSILVVDKVDVDALMNVVLVDVGGLLVRLGDLYEVVATLSHIWGVQSGVIGVFKRLLTGLIKGFAQLREASVLLILYFFI